MCVSESTLTVTCSLQIQAAASQRGIDCRVIFKMIQTAPHSCRLQLFLRKAHWKYIRRQDRQQVDERDSLLRERMCTQQWAHTVPLQSAQRRGETQIVSTCTARSWTLRDRTREAFINWLKFHMSLSLMLEGIFRQYIIQRTYERKSALCRFSFSVPQLPVFTMMCSPYLEIDLSAVFLFVHPLYSVIQELCPPASCASIIRRCTEAFLWQQHGLIKVKHPEKFPTLSLFFLSERK